MADNVIMRKIQGINDMVMESHEPFYPSIELSDLDIPEIKDWEIGEDYILQIKVTQKEIREGRAEEIYARFNIKEVGVVNKKKKESY